jgi:hypothetical protein
MVQAMKKSLGKKIFGQTFLRKVVAKLSFRKGLR